MANTQQARLTANFVDADGVRSAASVYAKVDPTSTVTQVKAMLSAFLTAIVGVSDAGLIGGEFTLLDLSAPVNETPPVAESSVDEVGLFNFKVPSSNRTWSAGVPALKDGMIVNGRINTADAVVQAYYQLLGAGAAGITYTNSDYLDLGALNATFRSNRKHRRALKHVSYTVA